uniref:Putative secreted protein n=1 Tax=Anopheles darlingi TaxID=43151 RepID=A0A2M4D916_ANODA
MDTYRLFWLLIFPFHVAEESPLSGRSSFFRGEKLVKGSRAHTPTPRSVFGLVEDRVQTNPFFWGRNTWRPRGRREEFNYNVAQYRTFEPCV